MVVLSSYKKTQIGYTHILIIMSMLMMLMMMKLEQGPTFFLLRHSDAHINCELY